MAPSSRSEEGNVKQDMDMFLKDKTEGEGPAPDLLPHVCMLGVLLSAQSCLHALPCDNVFKRSL